MCMFLSHGFSKRLVTYLGLVLAPFVGIAQIKDVPLASPNQLGYTIDHWFYRDGTPPDPVRATQEGTDGYLWLSTLSGFYRFDAVRAKFMVNPFQMGSGIFNPNKLLKDGAGRIWGKNEQGILFLLGTDNVIRVNPDIPGCPESISHVGISESGDAWIFTGRGTREIMIFRDGAFKHLVTLDTPDVIRDLAIDMDGFIWAYRSQSKGLWKFSPSGEILDHLFPDRRILKFWKSNDHRLALASEDQLFILREGNWDSIDAALDLNASMRNIYTHFVQDSEGNTWAALDQGGVLSISREGLRCRIDEPILLRENVQNMFVNEHNEVWIATDFGLLRLRSVPVLNWMDVDFLNEKTIDSMTVDSEGRLWAGGISKLIHFDPDTQRFTYEPLIADTPFHRVKTMEDGSQLLADDFGHLWSYADGELQKFDFKIPVIKRIFEYEGAIYLGTIRGLWKLDGNEADPVNVPSLSPRFFARDFFTDRSGNLWVLNSFHELFKLTKAGWETMIPYKSGRLRFNRLFHDGKDGFFINSNEGLLHYEDGEYTPIQDRDGYLSQVTSTLQQCSNGFMWSFSKSGLVQFERVALDAVLDGRSQELKVRIFAEKEGLPVSSFNVSVEGLNVTEDGDVWVCTRMGIARVPAAVALAFHDTPSYDIQMRIDSVLVDRESIYDDPAWVPTDPLIMMPSQYHLEIEYTALGLPVAETTRFKHRMVGLHDEWSDASLERSAGYEFLPAGTYRFEVQPVGLGADGQLASLDIRVLPVWWATWWFRMSLLFAIAGAIAALWWWKLNRLNQEKRLQLQFSERLIDSQEEERQRIAGELHDGLAQNLLIVKNRLQSIKGVAPDPLDQDLNEIADVVQQSIGEVRGISHALRPHQLDTLGFTKACRELVRSNAASSGIEIHSSIEDVDDSLSSEGSIHLYRIIQESFNNILKHADASQVEISLQKTDSAILLHVQDDGRGFNAKSYRGAEGKMKSFGLSGMDERVRLLGGSIELSSELTQGVSLKVIIPRIR